MDNPKVSLYSITDPDGFKTYIYRIYGFGNTEEFMSGVIYHCAREYDKAETNYLKTITKSNDVHAMYNLARLYEEWHKKDKAVEFYKMAIKNGDVCAMNNLGVFYYEQEEYDKAIEVYKLAIDKGNIASTKNLETLYLKIR